MLMLCHTAANAEVRLSKTSSYNQYVYKTQLINPTAETYAITRNDNAEGSNNSQQICILTPIP